MDEALKDLVIAGKNLAAIASRLSADLRERPPEHHEDERVLVLGSAVALFSQIADTRNKIVRSA